MSNAGAGFVKGEKNGNVISPKGTKTRQRESKIEELSQSDIESGELDSDSVVIEELGHSNKIRQRGDDEKPVKIDLDNITPSYKKRLNTFFDESELEEMSKTEEALTGKKKEDIDSVWAGIREDIESHNDRVRKRKAEKEKNRLKEFTKKGTKYDTKLSDLDGGSFVDLLQEGLSDNPQETQEEELSEALQQIEEKWSKSEPDTTINTPDFEIEQMAQVEWGNRDDVFAEFAKDFSESDNETEYITLKEGVRKVRTTEEELAQALLNHENEPFDGTVTIHNHDKDTGFVEATVSKE